MNNSNYKPYEFAELLNISVKTFQRWDREVILHAFRTVSKSNQKEDLKNQIAFLKQ